MSDFQTANRYIQQQNFEDALPILEKLYYENPGSLLFFEQYISSLVNLTRYEEAEAIARREMESDRYRIHAKIKLAEILHLKGDREEALHHWHLVAHQHRNNTQYYYTIGSSMLSRQEYDEAIDLYLNGRDYLGNPGLFINELADIYLQAGRFEESVNEFYQLILQQPDQMSLVQQRFFNMRDNSLYEIASYELEDLLLELHYTEAAYSPLYQLLTWLLLETNQYRRAFLFARQYENQTPFTIYSLFSLGSQFVSAREFELAVESFSFYLDDSNLSMRMRAKEELANSKTHWAQYLQQNNLSAEHKIRELYQKAYFLNSDIIDENIQYNRADRVLTSLIDLSVDYFKDLEKAKYWLTKMENVRDPIHDAFLHYAKGRIALFQKEFIVARQNLTRADRLSDNPNLSERARYYLGLSDFFAGDYEFAEIQLRSLERRNTSFYANDAIKLNIWIRNGIRADTTKSLLNTISDGLFQLHTGQFENALNTLEPILANNRNPFSADLTTELISVLPEDYNGLLLKLTERIISAQPHSSQKERLMWDKAVLVENMLTHGHGLKIPVTFQFLENTITPSYTIYDLIELYEDLIMEFPNGYYSTFVREKLQTLEQSQIGL